MEGTCNECVFPIDKEESERTGVCAAATSLTYAAATGRLPCVKELMAAGADVNATCECHGNGALISAAMSGDTDCLKELINGGAGINIQNRNGQTALMFARNTQCLTELINAGADVNIKDNEGNTTLTLGIQYGNMDFAEILISAGSDVNTENRVKMTPLMVAACEGHAKCLTEFIAAGADINRQDVHGKTALILSSLNGHTDCVKQLIDSGADVDTADDGGDTALMLAVRENHVECAKELIVVTADLNRKNKEQQTVLIEAAWKGNVSLMRMLVSAGADINARNENGSTLLMIVSHKGHSKCTKYLIDAGVDVNYSRMDGWTALMFAAKNGQIECVKKLITAGASVNPNNRNGFSSLMLAARSGHLECVKELIAAGADVNSSNSTGATSLILAANNGHIECVKELLAAGAEINKRTELFQTALLVATEEGHFTCVKELITAGADVNNSDIFTGNTALMTAVQISSKNIVQLLIDEGANINAENFKGETALYHAVTKGHTEFQRTEANEEYEKSCQIVYMLLVAGAHLHKTSSGLNPCAVHADTEKFRKSNPQILKMLFAGGADNIGKASPMNQLQDYSKCCIREHLKQIHPEKNLYITVPQLGLPINLQSDLLFYTLQKNNQILKNDEIQLLLKASEGDVESVLSLIEAGVAVNSQDEKGMTALIIASEKGNLKMVEQLIKAGAGLNIQTLFGDTALICATKSNQNDCVQKLLEYGAKMDIQGKDGHTALMVASMMAHKECLYTLIESGSNTNIQNDNGCTALILGATNLCIVEEIIKAEADVNCMDREGNTALTKASYSGNVDCVKKLIEYGADINGDGCNTALMAAARKDHLNCLKLLIEEGADLNILDERGDRALMYAVRNGSEKCFNALLKAGSEVVDSIDVYRVLKRRFNESHFNASDREQQLWRDILGPLMREFNLDSMTKIFQDVQDFGMDKILIDMAGKMFSTYFADESEDKSLNIRKLISSFLQHLKAEEAPSLTTMFEAMNKLHDNFFKMFFEAGGIPDFATNPKDFETLKDKLNEFPLSNCPMTITRKGRRYLATVAIGETTSLQGDKSDVKLEIKEGCPKRAYLMEVRTDLSQFRSFIQDDECFISPIVKVLAPAKTNTSSYTLWIPHCLDENDDRSKVKVRMIHENRIPTVVEVPKGSGGALYYDINQSFIELHATHFCHVICTICETPYHCLKRINTLWFARFDTEQQGSSSSQEALNFRNDVEIRPYFGGAQYAIVDFQRDMEATVNLRYINHRTLLTTKKGKIIPESGRVVMSLQVTDRRWKHRLGQWDTNSRTFREEKELLDVIDEGNCHGCDKDPIEAGSYCLQAEGAMIEQFRANGKAELTVDVEGASQQEEKITKHSVVDVRVDFPREEPERSLVPRQTPQRIKRKADQPELPADNKHQRTSKDTGAVGFNKKKKRFNTQKINEMVEAAGFEKLPPSIGDSEIARLAPLFSPSTLEMVALQHFGVSEAEVKSFKVENIHNVEGFKRSLLLQFRNRPGHTRKDLYSVLLESESEGILEDVNMSKVEKLILDPETKSEPEKISKKPLSSVDLKTKNDNRSKEID